MRRVPSFGAPRLVADWPAPPSELLSLVEGERARIRERLPRLPAGSLLRAYEECYGLDLEADQERGFAHWKRAVAHHPYPASLRARNVAVGVRLGRRGLAGELARACRAVLAQIELHLLGNHVLENGLALAAGGAVARGPEGELWWRAGCRILAWQLPEQFLEDGGHFERSVSYHLELTAGLLQVIELAWGSGKEVPELWLAVAERAVQWLRSVRAPDGGYPLFNDASLDAAPGVDRVLAFAQALGRDAGEPQPGLRVLDATGWVTVAVGDAWLAFDAGPDGAPYQPGHAHADALGFELWVGGRRAVVDYGVSSYLDDDARQRTRATFSHSTVELEGTDSCEVWRAFRVGHRQHATLLSAKSERDGAVRISASHDGYRRLPGHPTHVRTLELEPGRLRVIDRIDGGPSAGVSRLRLDAEQAQRLRVRGSGELERMDDVWHPRYSDPLPAVVLAQRIGSGMPAEFTLEW